MKAIVEYGPFSTMIDVAGDKRPIYFPKPTEYFSPGWNRPGDDVMLEHTAHKLEFDYKTDIEHHGNIIQIYRFVGES